MYFSTSECLRACALACALALGPLPAVAADVRVPVGGDLQAAINAARPGDTILLPPNATFVGNFRLPVHGGTTYITIRSSATDGLPDEGQRVTPAQAARLPKLRSGNSGPVLATAPGAAYWRLLLLELQPTQRGLNDIVTLGDGSEAQDAPAKIPHHLVLDRLYIHGDPLQGQKRGVALNSATTTIINCYIAGIRAIGQDSQAIAGWNGPGPYTIENNYLESAGEVVMFGGATVFIRDLVPSDIEIRRNTLTRPTSWRDPIVPAPAQATATTATGGKLEAGRYTYRIVARRPVYDTVASSPPAEVSAEVDANGKIILAWSTVPDATEYQVYGRGRNSMKGYWTVTSATFTDVGQSPSATGEPEAATQWEIKNLFELKNARRVHVAENVLEHNWAQAQNGTAILMTPRADNGKCPWCVVEDVTFEYNLVRHVGSGFNILGVDNYTPSQQTNKIRIRHNEFVDMTKAWGGTGYFALLQGRPRDIVIDHNTIVSEGGGGVIQVDGPPVEGFVLTNNIARHNSYGIIGNGNAPGAGTIRAFFPTAVITRNVLAGGTASEYPSGNLFPSVAQFESHFVDYRSGNFALRPGTDWAGKGTDGADLGAVFPAGVRPVAIASPSSQEH